MHLNQGQLSAGGNKLLPDLGSTMDDWLLSPTVDGKTLPNVKGTAAKLNAVNCLSFDGSNDHIDLPSVPSDLLNGVFDISFDILIDDTDTGFQRIIWFIGSDDFFRIQKNNGSNTLDFWCRNSSSNTIFRNSGISFTPDAMFNFRAVGDGTDVKIYYDGSLHVTISITGANKQASFTSATPSLSESTNALLGKLANFKMSSGSVLHTQLPIAEGSGTKDYDVSGNGNHGAITGSTWSTQDGIESWNHEYGFDATAVFDGTDDFIDTGVSATDQYTFEVTAKLNANSDFQGYFNTNERFFFGRNASTSVRFGYLTFNSTVTVANSIFDEFTNYKIQNGKLFIDGVEALDSGVTPSGTTLGNLYIGARFNDISNVADSFVNQEFKDAKIYDNNDVLVRDFVPYEDGLYDKVNGVYYSNDGTGTITTKRVPALNTKTTQVATFDGVADKLTATGISGSSVITHDGTATLSAGTNEITSTSGTAFNIKVDGVLTFTMSTGIGTTTITSENGAIGNASVTVGSGGLATFWGQRVADTSGSLVSADYAEGNLTISNPAGFVHNRSECSIEFEGGTDVTKTASDIASHSNSSDADLFFLKDGSGNVIQALHYDSDLTGTALTRTRAYVG